MMSIFAPLQDNYRYSLVLRHNAMVVAKWHSGVVGTHTISMIGTSESFSSTVTNHGGLYFYK